MEETTAVKNKKNGGGKTKNRWQNQIEKGKNPYHQYNHSGRWKNINLSVIPYGKNGYGYTCNKTWYDFMFKEHSNWGDGIKFRSNSNYSFIYQLQDYSYRDMYGSQDYISNIMDVAVETKDKKIPYSDIYNFPPTINLSGKYVNSSEIIYREIYPNVTVKYTPTPLKVKEEIIIKNLTKTPADYLSENKTLDFGAYIKYGNASMYVNGKEKTKDFITSSSIKFKDYKNQTLYSLPKPFAVDANGNKSKCYYEVKDQGNQIWFYTRVPYSFLKNATFPVVVDPTFEEQTVETNFDGVASLHVNDLDGDGDNDILATAGYTDEVAWWENTDGDGSSWTEHMVDANLDGAYSIYSDDFNGDGHTDIVASTMSPGDGLNWYENDGSESFTRHSINTSFESSHIRTEDIDGDGDADIVSGTMWWENDGAGSFTQHDIDTSFDGRCVDPIDLDGDGDTDIVASIVSTDTEEIVWYENDGSESFTRHNIDTKDDATSIYVVDMDGDTDLDIITNIAHEVSWYENNGSETFTRHVIDTFNPSCIHYADFDTDGDIDVTSGGSDTVKWHENDGSESFTNHVINNSLGLADEVYAEDIDGDGDKDITVIDFTEDSIYWFKVERDPPEIQPDSYDYQSVYINESTSGGFFKLYNNNSNDATIYAKASNTSAWTLSNTIGVEQYRLQEKEPDDTDWLNLTNDYQQIDVITAGNNQTLDFNISMPTSTSNYSNQTTTVTFKKVIGANISYTNLTLLSSYEHTDITPDINSYPFGTIATGESKQTTSGQLSIANDGNNHISLLAMVFENQTVYSANDTADADKFVLKISTDNWTTSTTLNNATFTEFDADLAPGSTLTYDYNLTAPTSASDYTDQAVWVQINGSKNTYELENQSVTFNIKVPDTPTVDTEGTSDIWLNSAKIYGKLTDMAGAPETDVYFQWGQTTSYGQTTSIQTLTSTGEFNASLSGLSEGTTYHYRAVGDNDGNISYGADESFVTKESPSVISDSATGKNDTEMTLNGDLLNLGSASSVEVYFEWGPTNSMTYNTSHQTLSSTSPFSATLTGLTPGETYYYRAVADGDGTDYGITQDETMDKYTPTVSTDAPSDIQRYEARIHGTLSGMGSSDTVDVFFQYGETTSYGYSTSAQTLTIPDSFSAKITSLRSGTTYHYRAVAIGSTVYGIDRSFTTDEETIDGGGGGGGSITPPTQPRVSIQVVDKNQIPISSAKISVDTSTYYTDEQGYVNFTISEGTYDLKIEKEGYKTVERQLEVTDDRGIKVEMAEPGFFGMSPVIFSLLTLVFLGALAVAVYILEIPLDWRHQNNWYGPAPEGSWTQISTDIAGTTPLLISVFFIVFSVWMIPNAPSLSQLGIFYVILLIIYMIVWLMERLQEELPLSVIDFGKEDVWTSSLLFGLMGGLIFVTASSILNIFTGQTVLQLVPLKAFMALGPAIASLSVVFLVPWSEESFFGAFLTPTLAEKIGVIPALLVISVVFGVFHFVAYGADIGLMVSAMVFRFMASFLNLHQKSMIPGLVAHILINFMSII